MIRLYEPASYYYATKEKKNCVCNGCGSNSSFIDYVPDKIIGLDISEACNIHDWMYHKAKELTPVERERCDKYFKLNMLVIINDGIKLLQYPRTKIALLYFLAVRKYGAEHFFKKTMGEIYYE